MMLSTYRQWILLLLSNAGMLMAFKVTQDKDTSTIPVSWENTKKSDAVVFDAFGEKYRLKLVPEKMKRVPEVVMYTSRGGIVDRHAQKDKPLDVYQDGDTLITVRRRWARQGWVPQMDGLISTRAGQFYVRSRPNMMFHNSLRHYVQRRAPHKLYNDYYQIESKVDDVISRYRRGRANIQAVVDLLVIVDYALYRDALKEQSGSEAAALSELRSYYKLLIAMVDLRYSRINDPLLAIRVRLVGIFVAQDPLGAPWAEEHLVQVEDGQVLEPGIALENLHLWLKKQFADRVLPNHDHAMAFTGYAMYNIKSETETAGMAYIGTICKISDGYSASVIEEVGGFANVGTVTHELGHSLGAHHDGSGTNADCPAENNFMMTPQNLGGENFKNFFSFSQCSLRDFKHKLRMEQADCLFDSTPKQYKGKLPGQIVGVDQQCSQLFGEGSVICPIKQVVKNICLRLWCQKPGKSGSCVTTQSLSAIYGTSCGQGKICMHGSCEPEENAKTAKPPAPPVACPHGDRNQGYCYRLMLIRSKACERKEIASYCCASCRLRLPAGGR